jgi:hypothetical protein
MPFYRHNHGAATRWQSTPGKPIWSLRHDHVTWSCEFRFHGESYGWEAQIVRESELVIGRRFDTRALAVQWAEEERKIRAATRAHASRLGLARISRHL